MTTILLFIAILGVLILVHEFGHFIVAKRAKAKVEEFGIGFPPRVFGIKRGETIYSVNLFPIGGFVKVFGEDGESREDPRSFGSKNLPTRALVIVAGVFMNLFLAVVILTLGHIIGLPQIIDGEGKDARLKNITIRVADVAPDSPAAAADIKLGDVIYSMRSDTIEITGIADSVDVQNFTSKHLGQRVILEVKRGEKLIAKEIIPRPDPPEGEGPIGFAMVKIGRVAYPLYIAPWKGIESTALITWGTIKGFGSIIVDFARTGELRGDLAGPVGIAVITGQVSQMGFIFLLQFIALISINLAVINVLPFPALDGGRLLFLAIEKLKGSPVKQKYEKFAHTIGFAALIALMIVVTFRDIGRFL